MRRIAPIVAFLILGSWPTVLMAEEQFEARHPSLYLSVPLTAWSKPNQPLAELGFAIRESHSSPSEYSGSSRQLQLVNFAFSSRGLRNWSAFGIDMTKLHANGDSSDKAEGSTGPGPLVVVGAVVGAVLVTALYAGFMNEIYKAQTRTDCSRRC